VEDSLELRLRLPATAAAQRRVRLALGGITASLELDELFVADVMLAVSEAVGNVVAHAYEEEGGQLELDIRCSERELSVRVRDFGRGPNGPSPTPGLGLGLGVMRTLSASCEVSGSSYTGTTAQLRFPIAARRAPRRHRRRA
jgi:anti-sigma regulatory factor (Ser/Thr protein kinase)